MSNVRLCKFNSETRSTGLQKIKKMTESEQVAKIESAQVAKIKSAQVAKIESAQVDNNYERKKG